MNPLHNLQSLFKKPEHRVIFQAPHHWVSVRSFQPANRMLMEVCSNKNLPREHAISESQMEQLHSLGLGKRRQGYSLGKLYNIEDSDGLVDIANTINSVFTTVFETSPQNIQTTICPSPSIHLYNRILIGQMNKLARSKEHQLRLNLYTTLIDATLIALVDDNGALKKCDTISNFDCFGAFTDEKHALQYDPRGQGLKTMPMINIIQLAVQQNAGSLWLNPKGETRGELYKNELDSLWSRVKRLL